ncbi:MAG: hypothetical protein EOO75_20850 [Myxococcales bacterium]|nr:MAG: hypothetical protein EOO75_20850 [Myxococcales bacterium]
MEAADQGRLEALLARARLPTGGDWTLAGVRVGGRPADQPVLRGRPLLPPGDLMPRYLPSVLWQAWPKRLGGIELDDPAGAPSPERFLVAGLVDGVVVSVESYASRTRPPLPADTQLACEAHDGSLRGRGPGFERRSEPLAQRCEWRWREADHALTLALEPDEVSLRLSSASRLATTVAEAEATLHEQACRQCERLRPGFTYTERGHHRGRSLTVLSIDRARCTMTFRVPGDEDDGPVAPQEEPCRHNGRMKASPAARTR